VERLFALGIGDILDLVEAGDGVAHVRGVVQRLFALRRKCKRGSSIFFRSSVERECSES